MGSIRLEYNEVPGGEGITGCAGQVVGAPRPCFSGGSNDYAAGKGVPRRII